MATVDFLSAPDSSHPPKRFPAGTAVPAPSDVATLTRSWKNKAKPKHPDIAIAEVREMFKGQEDRYPPILSNAQAAALAGIKVQSLDKQRCQGRYEGCYIPGNPVLFFRDKFMVALFRSRGK